MIQASSLTRTLDSGWLVSVVVVLFIFVILILGEEERQWTYAADVMNVVNKFPACLTYSYFFFKLPVNSVFKNGNSRNSKIKRV